MILLWPTRWQREIAYIEFKVRSMIFAQINLVIVIHSLADLRYQGIHEQMSQLAPLAKII